MSKRSSTSLVLAGVGAGAAAVAGYAWVIRPWTLRHWICDRKIEVVKYGNGLVRIRRSVLDRFIASCTIKARHHHGRRRPQDPRLLERTDLGSGDQPMAG